MRVAGTSERREREPAWWALSLRRQASSWLDFVPALHLAGVAPLGAPLHEGATGAVALMPSAGWEAASSSESPPPIPDLVASRYEIKNKVGSGSYSEVYLGVDSQTGEQVAVKFEWQHAVKTGKLLAEARLCEELRDDSVVPKCRWWGSEDEYNIMVMDLLGPSLEYLFSACGKRFRLPTVLMVAEQLIDRIEYVHSCGILHRDIKPNNFLVGLQDKRCHVYIADFGLAKRFIVPETGEHIPYTRKKGLTGTVRYVSLNVHRGHEPSRRDDLGSIGYVLMYLLSGRLPWQGINASDKKVKQQRIGRRKKLTPHEDLCKGFPHEFVSFFEHCDSLAFEERPDYALLKRLMRDALLRLGSLESHTYDWSLDSVCQKLVDDEKAAAQKRMLEVAARKQRSPSPKRRKKDDEIDGQPGAEEERSEYEYEYEEYDSEEEEEEEEEESTSEKDSDEYAKSEDDKEHK